MKSKTHCPDSPSFFSLPLRPSSFNFLTLFSLSKVVSLLSSHLLLNLRHQIFLVVCSIKRIKTEPSPASFPIIIFTSLNHFYVFSSEIVFQKVFNNGYSKYYSENINSDYCLSPLFNFIRRSVSCPIHASKRI